jgi:hypothetical protein
MSITLPSNHITVIDVPEVKEFTGNFVYNFFVPDEATNDSGNVIRKFAQKRTDQLDVSFDDKTSSRIPRYIRLSYKPVFLHPTDNTIDDNAIRNRNITDSTENFQLIKDNYDKIQFEDNFSGERFTVVDFNDKTIDQKLHNLISSSWYVFTDGVDTTPALSPQELATNINKQTSKFIDKNFLNTFLNKNDESGAFFYDKNGVEIKDSILERLKNIKVHMQMNEKFISKIATMTLSGLSTHATNLLPAFEEFKVIEQDAINNSTNSFFTSDYISAVDHISVSEIQSKSAHIGSTAIVIGYVIDKQELVNGQWQDRESIIIDNSKISSTVDFKVKYYSTYKYYIRTITLLEIPAVVSDRSDVVMARILISSKRSVPVVITCFENVPPPPPTDFRFIWDYRVNRLQLSWTFPPNKQRDIKKFQIFRRSNINEPYQLQAQYDFDDSVVKATPTEIISTELVKIQLRGNEPSPILSYIDNEFTKNSKYIYTLCCIDAHGLTSNYCDQFEITFDKYKNSLVRKLISEPGAPKAYPNMLLNSDTFIDVIYDTGHTSVKIIFNPDHLTVYDADGNDLNLIATSDTFSDYKLQFVNLDTQKERVLNLNLIDYRNKTT